MTTIFPECPRCKERGGYSEGWCTRCGLCPARPPVDNFADPPTSKIMIFKGTGKPQLSKAKCGPTPTGMDPKRWKQHHKNVQRAEAYTGICPFSADGWESVAVSLMNALDQVNKKRKHKIRAKIVLVKKRQLK